MRFPARDGPLRRELLARSTWVFSGNPVGQEAGSTPLGRVEPARGGDFKFTRVNKLSLKVSSSSSARGHNVTMLTSTTHVFGPCCGWSWLHISAIAKDFLGISRVSSRGVETVVVPQSLCSSRIQVKSAQRRADTNMTSATTFEDTKINVLR